MTNRKIPAFWAPLWNWCHAILPTVYDDSLSYYEVLCKLSKHVNDLGNVINNIITTGTWNAVVAYTRPEFYGAVGDGVTDDSVAVQSALEDGRDNDKIVLLSKSYLIGNTLIVPEGAVIVGQNGGELISAQKQINGFVPTTILNISNSCFIKNVKFNGNCPAGNSTAIPDSVNHNSLIRVNSASNVYFDNCYFTNFDTNWGGSEGVSNFSCLAVKNSSKISITNCTFYRIFRECATFNSSSYINIDGCSFDCGNEPFAVYSDIGIGLTNYVRVHNCRIVKGDDLTTSAINAMGNDIVIDGCYIKAIKSDHGVDWGNEIGIGFTATNLTIRNCTINARVWPKSDINAGLAVHHDNVFIHHNLFINTGLTGTAVIMVYAESGEHIEICDNTFTGSGDPYGIRLAHHDGVIKVEGNTFRTRGIYLSDNVETVTIMNNVFNALGVMLGTKSETEKELPLIGCRFNANIGNTVSNNKINVIAIGCYLETGIFTINLANNYSRVDKSLSWVKSVGKGGDIHPDDEEEEEPVNP